MQYIRMYRLSKVDAIKNNNKLAQIKSASFYKISFLRGRIVQF